MIPQIEFMVAQIETTWRERLPDTSIGEFPEVCYFQPKDSHRFGPQYVIALDAEI